MSDAAHMLSDVSSFLVAIFAAWAATQPGTQLYSFGYHRAEILGALVSVLIIWLVTGALVFEAVQRTINPVRVDGKRERAGRPGQAADELRGPGRGAAIGGALRLHCSHCYCRPSGSLLAVAWPMCAVAKQRLTRACVRAVAPQ
jgi:hypothetical protein